MPRPWRLARALEQLRDEVNDRFPNRSKRSDGTIGDAAHATRDSDHNPWVSDGTGIGVVTAIDITHDPAAGFDAQRLVDHLTKSSHDRRIKYVIFNRRIYSSYATSGYPAWAARAYSGPNPHDKHVHISVESRPGDYDDTRSWGVAKAFAPKPKPDPGHAADGTVPPFPLRRGYYFGPRYPLSNFRSVSGYFRHAKDLRRWQQRMKARGWTIGVTGRYDAATERVARAFQREKHLEVTGRIGPQTWAAAWTAPVTKG